MPGRIRAGLLTSVWVQFSPWLFNVTRPAAGIEQIEQVARPQTLVPEDGARRPGPRPLPRRLRQALPGRRSAAPCLADPLGRSHHAMGPGTAGRARLSRPLRLPHRHHQQPHPGRRRRHGDLSLQGPRRRPPAPANRHRPRVHPALPPARPAGRLPQGPLLRPVACLAPTAAQPQECSPAGATRQATGPTRTRARRRPPGPAIAAPLPALPDRPSDTAAPVVAGPAARPVTITMLPTPTPPTPFRTSVVRSRDRRRSPAATPQSSQIAPRLPPDQPIEWHQPATLLPILPCILPTGSS